MPVALNQWYGRLYTTARLPNDGSGRVRWLCNCICGTPLVVVRGDLLLSGNTTSCGCSRRTSLGLSSSPTYKTWAAMRRRCNDANHPRYEDYGGRGIRVCPRWDHKRTGFAAFVADMGIRPDDMTLDRVDTDGNYSKANCRWATLIEQRWNRRDMRASAGSEERSERAYWDEQERLAAATAATTGTLED